jgi:hypothetical protein
VGTGLIYGAIVLVWAAFLVPWALRRYDEAAQARSIERFSTAMRVLGRDDDTPEGPAPQPSRAAARAAAQRRRRTLLVLLGLTAVVLALGVVSVVPLWLTVVPLLLVVSFLVACRRQARREAEVWWSAQRRSPATRPNQPGAVRPASRVESSYGGLRQPVGDDPDDEPTVVLSADALVEGEAVAVPVTTSDGASLWDPLPVTLPTYVSKPRAGRTIRTIDLDAEGTWTSGHVVGEQTTMPEAEPEPPKEQRAVGS